MDSPLVSVVIPTFNRSAFVVSAVESVLSQDGPEIEVIVIDDGSIDDTRERLSRFGDAIRYHQQENRGMQAARNRGVRMARGAFLAMLDSDDLWLPGKLEGDLAMFDADPELGMVCGRMEVIDQDGARTGLLKPAVSPGRAVLEVLRAGSALFSSFTFRREVYDRVGGFDEALRRFTDLDFTLAVLQHHRIGVYEEPRVLYRDHAGNLSKDLFGIYVGRFHLTDKWYRKFTEPEARRIALDHVRDCAGRLAKGYLLQGRLLKSLRFGAAYVRARLRRPDAG